MQSRAALTAATLGATGAVAGVLAYATLSPTSQLFGPMLVAPPRPNELALTFDDGPNPNATPHLLDLLAEHGVRATFFLIGSYALTQPELARRIVQEGHTVGNHTMTHPKLPLCSRARITQELTDAQHAFEDTISVPVTLFRSPHGFRTPYVLQTARSLGLTPVAWNIIGNDWMLPSSEAITTRVLAGIARSRHRGDAANVVLHDGDHRTPQGDRSRTVAATAAIIDHVRRAPAGPKHFVTLDSWLDPKRSLPRA